MKRVALCIPTYNKEECVRDMLENCAPYYLQYGMDIIYYDSSPDDKTEKIIDEKRGEYGERLQFNKLPSDLHSNKKVYKIYQGYGYQLEAYDYLWLCSDAIQFTPSALEKIYRILEKDYDVIVNEPGNEHGIGSKEFHDANDFFQNCAWGLGSIALYGTTILNVRTMLKGVDWEKYEQYLNERIINFSHVSFMLNRILEIPDFKGYHLQLESREFRSSVYKKAASWHDSAFSIICGQFVRAIENLPADYDSKINVIRKNGESFGLGKIRRFIEFRAENVYNLRVFREYFGEWNKVSPISRLRLCLIAVLPKAFCEKICYKNKKKLSKLFEGFYKKHTKILLYGAGKSGMIYANYFEKEKISFDGFCVSNAQGKTSFMEHPLYSVNDVDFTPQTGVVVAVQEENARDVLKLLKQREVAEEHVFFSQDFFNMISFELGYRG